MKRLGDFTPSHHLEHISNNQTRWKSFKNCVDSQKNRDTNGLSIFQLVLQPLGTFKVLSSAINFLGSQEPTDWMNDQPSCYLLICLASFSKKSFVICLNNHDVVSSKIQNRLLVHQLQTTNWGWFTSSILKDIGINCDLRPTCELPSFCQVNYDQLPFESVKITLRGWGIGKPKIGGSMLEISNL